MSESENVQAGKSPLDFALESFATPETRKLVLEMCHAVVSHCMTTAAVQGTGDAVQRAAEFTCYGRIIQEIQLRLPNHSSIPIPKRTVYTTPQRSQAATQQT